MNILKKRIDKPLYIAGLCLIIGLVLIFIAPWFFTQNWGIIEFNDKTGSIGDTIGGTTAPITNLLGAVLVFLALVEQVKANKIIQRQIDNQEEKELINKENEQLHRLYNYLEESVKNYKFTSLNVYDFKDNQEDYICEGSTGIHTFFSELRCNYHGSEDELMKNPCVTELISILKICNSILDKLEQTKALDKDLIKTLTKHQFEFRIMPALYGLQPEDLELRYCESCGNNHGIPTMLLDEIKNAKHRLNEF